MRLASATQSAVQCTAVVCQWQCETKQNGTEQNRMATRRSSHDCGIGMARQPAVGACGWHAGAAHCTSAPTRRKAHYRRTVRYSTAVHYTYRIVQPVRCDEQAPQVPTIRHWRVGPRLHPRSWPLARRVVGVWGGPLWKASFHTQHTVSRTAPKPCAVAIGCARERCKIRCRCR